MADKKFTTSFEEDKDFISGRELGFQHLLRVQIYWINKAFAMNEKLTIINLVFGLESMLIAYIDKTYKKENKELIDNNKSKFTIAKHRYRLLIGLMDRKNLLLERGLIDEI